MPPNPPVIPDSHDPLTFPPQPGLGKERPQLHSWLEGSGHCLPTVARMVFESFAHVPVTKELLRHVWEGEDDPAKGGHRFGLGREGKTEFPQEWDLAIVKLAIVAVLEKPQFVGHRGSSVILKKQVGEVIVEVKLRIIGSTHEIEHAYPINGAGVFRNQSGLRKYLPLTIQSLEA